MSGRVPMTEDEVNPCLHGLLLARDRNAQDHFRYEYCACGLCHIRGADAGADAGAAGARTASASRSAQQETTTENTDFCGTAASGGSSQNLNCLNQQLKQKVDESQSAVDRSSAQRGIARYEDRYPGCLPCSNNSVPIMVAPSYPVAGCAGGGTIGAALEAVPEHPIGLSD